jgi:hypothetical protein
MRFARATPATSRAGSARACWNGSISALLPTRQRARCRPRASASGGRHGAGRGPPRCWTSGRRADHAEPERVAALVRALHAELGIAVTWIEHAVGA